MTELNDFKTIADGFMNDIYVGRELKEKTLLRCLNKKHVSVGRMLAAVACLVLILGLSPLFVKLPQFPDTAGRDNQEMNIMAAPNNSVGIAGFGTDTSSGTETFREWTPETVSDARTAFGKAFLEPTSVPEDFKAGEIAASGKNAGVADKVILNYNTIDRSFMIIEEKADLPEVGLNNYRTIDINGVKGYLKPEEAGDRKGADTEVHWFKNGVHYTVAGLISDDEALEIASSMK